VARASTGKVGEVRTAGRTISGYEALIATSLSVVVRHDVIHPLTDAALPSWFNPRGMTHWRRLHDNGWAAEVQLALDGRYYYRAYEQTVIPADCTDWTFTLGQAQRAADADVPVHDCRCPPWEQWF
jgi:hypothetical protein